MRSLKNIRPFIIHILILVFFIIIGIVLIIAETLSEYDGGWLFGKYILTKLYFLILVGYSLFSTLVVSSVWFFYKRKKKVLSKLTIILCHVIPIGIGWAFFSFGLHDFIQYKAEKKDFYIPPKTQTEKIERKRPLESPTFDPNKMKVKEAGQTIEAEKQEGE